MNKHDYRNEILGILASNQNCIVGFNKLLKMGSGKGFHPNFLKLHLNKLEAEGLIITKKIGNKLETRRVEIDFEKEFSKFTKDLERLETRLTRKDLTDEDRRLGVFTYMELALQKNKDIVLDMLYNFHSARNVGRLQINEKARKKLFRSMNKILKLLKKEEKKPILDHLFQLNHIELVMK